MGRLTAIEAPQRYLAVTWQVNNFCNYRCSYCNPGNYSGTHSNDSDLPRLIDNLDRLLQTYEQAGYQQFKFFFSGGEPTAWRLLIPLCTWLRDRLSHCTIAVNTNLSRPLAWWQQHYRVFDDVVASFHVEFADKQRYEDVSVWLCDKVNYLATKLLMHDERFWEVAEYGEHLKTVMPNHWIEWTPLFDEMSVHAGPWHYADPDKREFFATHSTDVQRTLPRPSVRASAASWSRFEDGVVEPTNSNQIIVDGLNFFQGWHCSVGDALFINPQGVMSFASCGQGGEIGHILDDISAAAPREITCGKSHCHCGTDIIIPKHRGNQHHAADKDSL